MIITILALHKYIKKSKGQNCKKLSKSKTRVIAKCLKKGREVKNSLITRMTKIAIKVLNKIDDIKDTFILYLASNGLLK